MDSSLWIPLNLSLSKLNVVPFTYFGSFVQSLCFDTKQVRVLEYGVLLVVQYCLRWFVATRAHRHPHFDGFRSLSRVEEIE